MENTAAEAISHDKRPVGRPRLVVPTDNLNTRSVGPMSSFIFAWLIRADIRKDTDSISFDWVPCPVRGSVWANTKLVDSQDDNLMHEVAVAPDDTFRPDPGDKIRRSALGLHPVPLSEVTYLCNLENLGYERALDFVSRVHAADATTESGTPGGAEGNPDENAALQGKATDKCRPKSLTKELESTIPSLDVTDEIKDTIKSHEMGADEAAEEVDDNMLAEGNETQDGSPSDHMTANEVRELLHDLMRKSTILNDCRTRVSAAVSKAVAERTAEMFKPFTGYIEDITHEVSSWHMGILSVCPKMVNCDYETYRENSSLIREKTNAFYERAWALNKSLDKSTTPKQAVRHDSGGKASGSSTDEIEDPFLAEIPNIMTDVEDSVTQYADKMAKKVLEHTGGVDISSYLGHIFNTGLNFQTSMWQLVTLEAVYLPTIMRENVFQCWCHVPFLLLPFPSVQQLAR